MIFEANLSNRDFQALSQFIHQEIGIKMPDSKKIMVEGRLRKRLRVLNFQTFADYCRYIFSKDGLAHERIHIIDAITTNKTDFFREAIHFDILTKQILPDLLEEGKSLLLNPFKIWSAGCSTGEEPYTLAMILSDFQSRFPQNNFQFKIIASDISSRVLKTAKNAIYDEQRTQPIPLNLKKKYLLKSRDKTNKIVKIAKEIRTKVEFKHLNFLDDHYGFSDKFSAVFFRNVMIYFERPLQYQILQKITDRIHPGGFLFLGHSENLSGFELPLKNMAPALYRKLT
jgi:chemotaxis protein methyltransferase CheR